MMGAYEACDVTGAYQACEGCERKGAYEVCEVTGAYQACEGWGAYEACEVRVAVLFAIFSVEWVVLVFFFEVWAVCEGMGAYAVRLVSHVMGGCDSR